MCAFSNGDYVSDFLAFRSVYLSVVQANKEFKFFKLISTRFFSPINAVCKLVQIFPHLNLTRFNTHQTLFEYLLHFYILTMIALEVF